MVRFGKAMLVAGMALCAPQMLAQAKVGTAAPEFSATDSNGKTQTLSQYRGKYVVLEWANKDCPFDRAHYETGNMEKLQREWTAKGVVWLTVESSAQGKQGYMTPAEVNAYARSHKMGSTAVLMDASGSLGHLYGAKTTPHIFIIAPDGKLIYNGAIDDHPSTDTDGQARAKNYVQAALAEAMAGQPVQNAATRPYGCSVKYAGE